MDAPEKRLVLKRCILGLGKITVRNGELCFTFFSFLFLTSLLQRYIHGAFEDMRHWCIQHFISHIKHEMKKHIG